MRSDRGRSKKLLGRGLVALLMVALLQVAPVGLLSAAPPTQESAPGATPASEHMHDTNSNPAADPYHTDHTLPVPADSSNADMPESHSGHAMAPAEGSSPSNEPASGADSGMSAAMEEPHEHQSASHANGSETPSAAPAVKGWVLGGFGAVNGGAIAVAAILKRKAATAPRARRVRRVETTTGELSQ